MATTPTAGPVINYSRPLEAPKLANLAELIDEVDILLNKITGVWSELLIVHERRDVMRRAYDDLSSRKVFASVKISMDSADTEEALKEAGLETGGVQLEMKLGKGRSLWERFWQSAKPKWLVRLLGWINSILKSLAAAVGLVEVIRELKDACEEELKDVLDD